MSEDNFRPMPKKAKKKKATKKTLKRTPLKKKSAKKKPKKVSKTTVKNRCDRLWSELIRSQGYCDVCGTTENLQAHHIITRRRLATRYMKENGICLCAKHHQFCDIISAHTNPMAFANWFIKKYGEERLDWLQEQARNPEKWNLAKYEETEKDLKMMLGK